jgi:hypothetical protein
VKRWRDWDVDFTDFVALLSIVLALSFVGVLAAAVAARAEGLPDGSTLPPHKTVTLHGLCEGWKAWRTREGDLWIVCPGGPEHPAGAVELRAYYVLR